MKCVGHSRPRHRAQERPACLYSLSRQRSQGPPAAIVQTGAPAGRRSTMACVENHSRCSEPRVQAQFHHCGALENRGAKHDTTCPSIKANQGSQGEPSWLTRRSVTPQQLSLPPRAAYRMHVSAHCTSAILASMHLHKHQASLKFLPQGLCPRYGPPSHALPWGCMLCLCLSGLTNLSSFTPVPACLTPLFSLPLSSDLQHFLGL